MGDVVCFAPRSHPLKIAVLYQNDDYGKEYLIGLRDGLGRQGRQ